MPRWLLWTPIAALTVATAVFGLRAGWHVSSLSESDVINKAAAAYVQGARGRVATDCVAVPSPDRAIWLVVTCTPDTGVAQTYHATRFGKVALGVGAVAKPEI